MLIHSSFRIFLTFTILIAVIALLSVFTSQKASASSWLSGWDYRKQITISHTNVGPSDLNNFPLLIKINADSDMATALANGDDIRFTQSDGTTLLSYERESWSGGNGSAVTAIFWVKVPIISYTTDTNIYIYYGNSSASDGQSASSVWNNYTAVWHMNDNASNTTILDSTGTYNLTNAANTNTKSVTGEIGNGLSYNGSSDSSSNADINLSSTNAVTLSMWVNRAWLVTGTGELIEDSAKYFQNDAFAIIPDDNTDCGSSAYPLIIADHDGSGNLTAYCYANPTSGTWHLLTAVYDRTQSIGNQVKFYVDGTLQSVGNTIQQSDDGGNFSTYPFYVAARAGTSNFIAANLNELRIIPSALTAGWINFEYYNDSSANNELTFASQETNLTPTPTQIPIPTTTTVPTSTSSTSNSTASSTPNPNAHANWSYAVEAGPDFIGTPSFISNPSDEQSAKVLIPNNASNIDIYVTIQKFFGDALIKQLSHDPFPWMQGFNTVSEIYQISAVSAFNSYPVENFTKPVIVIVPYDPTKLSGIDPHRLRIVRYDTLTNKWIVLENNTVLNIVNHTVANTTTDLTYFAVVYPAITQNSVTKILGASASNKKITKIDGKSASPEINTKVTITNQKKTCFLFVCW